MDLINLNTRKERQHVDSPSPIGITAIFVDKHGKREEFFSNDELHDSPHRGETQQETVKNIYDNFNRTLRL